MSDHPWRYRRPMPQLPADRSATTGRSGRSELLGGSPDEAFELVATSGQEPFTVADTTAARAPNVMSWLERRFGRPITSRTWLTVHRVLERMS